ncbi:MAG: long-chain fatty acid--CoA ligase [Actinobacteria bacterium]|nr:long-chain fatty acid--CoA ligase [Actinomycetota bacterium]MCB9412263.1 long-chain fatty acid--CoA ligase [Actinomycetota bacterium]
MREFLEPALIDYPSFGNLCDDVERRASQDAGEVMLRRRLGASWVDVTAGEFRREVISVAKGIIAAGVGLGDRVGVMSATRYEWTLVDYAIWYAGGVTVPIYETSSAEQVQWILSDSAAVAVFLEGDKHKAAFKQAKPDLPAVESAWVFDEGAIDALIAAGEQVTDAEVDQRRSAVGPDDLCTIIYTSGTTGRPKGCELTHGNFMFDVRNVVNSMPELFLTNDASTLLFLPIAHVFGRLVQIGCINSGTVLGHSADIKDILGDLATFQRTFLLAVPRVFEKVYNSSEQKAAAGGKSKIFNAAVATAIDFSRAQDSGGPSILLRVKHLVFDKLVYSKLRAALGGKVMYAVSGGAPLGERLGHFFRGVGVTILEGYGLTETTGASTINRPDKVKIGTVGKPIPGAGVRIADDGEVMISGGQIFQGYWNNEAATAEAIEPDGWFHSGDIGELDSDGYLRITGRKNELIVTAGGKNVAPAVLEDRLRSHFLISQCMVVGDQKPYIAALITLDPESLAAWAGLNGLPETITIAEAAGNDAIRAEIDAAVESANKAVSNAEAIKRYHILERDWTEEGGQLTPSLKLKRNVVMAEFADEVVRLYD